MDKFKSLRLFRLNLLNSELFRIATQLRHCGEELSKAQLIDKTLSTFPPILNVIVWQYKNMKFRLYSKLISALFLAETQQQIELKNAESKYARRSTLS